MFVNSLKGDDAPPQTVERRWEKKKESTGRGPVDPFGPFEDGGGTSRGWVNCERFTTANRKALQGGANRMRY